MTAAAPPFLSVVLCTRNRRDSLARCLDYLAVAAGNAPEPWELLVVDNGSGDGTSRLLEERQQEGILPLRCLLEPMSGLARARNRGLASAEGKVIVFLDDDCLVDPTWLAALLAAYRGNQAVDAVGGRVDLHDTNDLPTSIRPFDEALAITDLPTAFTRLIGCNFSARADALQRVGGFDQRLGAGTPAGSAEDLDLFHRLLRAGCRMRYDPAVRLAHAHGRSRPEQILSLNRNYLLGRGAFYAKHALRGDLAVLRLAAWEAGRLLRRALLVAGQRRRNDRSSQSELSALCRLGLLSQGVWLRLTGR